MENKVEFYIHKGSNWSRGEYKPDLSKCRYSVTEFGRVTDWHQCTRKAVEDVEGYKFCKQHANEIKSRLGIRGGFAKERYAASFTYGKPDLAKLYIYGETDKTIDVESYDTLMGSCFGISTGKQLKTSAYVRNYKFFDNFTDAIAWLYEQSEKNVQSTLLAYEAAIQVRNKLEAEFLELAPKEE